MTDSTKPHLLLLIPFSLARVHSLYTFFPICLVDVNTAYSVTINMIFISPKDIKKCFK